MKAFVILFSLISVQAFACPNFTGTYTCKDEDGRPYKSVITQRNIKGGTIYTTVENGETFEFIVDGKQHVADPEQPKVKYTANCAGEVVKALITGPIEDNGRVVGSAKSNSQTFLKNKDLVTKAQTEIIYNGEVYHQENESACTRK